MVLTEQSRGVPRQFICKQAVPMRTDIQERSQLPIKILQQQWLAAQLQCHEVTIIRDFLTGTNELPARTKYLRQLKLIVA